MCEKYAQENEAGENPTWEVGAQEEFSRPTFLTIYSLESPYLESET